MSKKNKSKGGIPGFIFFLFLLGWGADKLGIDLERQRPDSKYYDACQCTDMFDTLELKLKAPNAREEKILDELLVLHNLPPEDYKLCKTKKIPDFAAYATQKNGSKYIIYDQKNFEEMDDLNSIRSMGHEIGHHVHAHTYYYKETKKERWEAELEADEYSGASLYKAGYSLSKAISTISNSEKGSETHPPGKQRREAIRRGWKNASTERSKPNKEQEAIDKKYAKQIALDFFQALGKGDFKKAYELQEIESWGTYKQFSSTQYFGGITKVEIIKPPKDVKYSKGPGYSWVKISLEYLSVDPVNDKCSNGKIYDQYFWIKGFGDSWKIAKASLRSSRCNSNV